MSLSVKKLLGWLRPLGAIAVIAILVAEIGTEELTSALADLTPVSIGAALGVIGIDSLIRSYNWSLLLRVGAPRVSYSAALHSYLAGGFWGSLIPSSLGPDMARATLASRSLPHSLGTTFVSVLLLNLISLWSLACLAAVGSAWWIRQGGVAVLFQVILAVAVGIVVGLPVILFLYNRFRQRVRLPAFISSRLERLRPASTMAAQGPLVRVAALAAITHLLHVTLAWVLSWGLGLEISAPVFLLVLPVVVMARLLPISIAGFGAEQGIFTLVFQAVGVEPASAFALSLVMSGSMLLFNALCGLVAMREARPAGESSVASGPADR